ncbi:diguanylate cyclase domain-containing protein [Xanthobacter pseudotagetidis]|uniref:diguanylate cyclase domain-containing protein n=1 Tax=Xanthobacter pseudotagetidis TaxID=3119911 RepID=UPI00372B9D25
MVTLSLSPLYLSGEFAHIALGPRDAVGAVHLPDGTYLARNTDPKAALGKAVDPARPYLQRGSPATGDFIAKSTYEPVERLYAWARLAQEPVVVLVGLSMADLLARVQADIWRQRGTNLAGTGLLLALGSLACLLALRDVRQRRALIDQEALYHSLFEQNHSVKLIVDPAGGRILAANAAAATFYGYSREALAGMNIAEINRKPSAEIAEAMKAAADGRGPHFIAPHRLASGEIRMVEVYSGPVVFDGKPALYSIVHDISARFHLERALRASEERYRSIFEVVPAGMVLVNELGEIVAWNATAIAMLHTDAAGLVTRTKELFDRSGNKVPRHRRPSSRCRDEDVRDEVYYVTEAAGGRTWINVNSRRIIPPGEDQPSGAVLTFSDITRSILREESLLISQRVFEASGEGIVVIDANGCIERVNAAFEQITGIPSAEAIGLSAELIADRAVDPAVFAAIRGCLAEKRNWEGELDIQRKDGTEMVLRAVISAIDTPAGTPAGHVALLSDITVRKRQEEEIWRRANFDALTGLPNRTLLMERIRQALALARRRSVCAGVLFMDLDRFKAVNDRWGHAAGDELLRHVGRRIGETVRAEDTVARIGGDEFVVLLPMVRDEEEAAEVAAKILATVRRPFKLTAGEANVAACIGVAVSNDAAMDPTLLIGRADAAMYRGKANGRDQVTLFSEQDAQIA